MGYISPDFFSNYPTEKTMRDIFEFLDNHSLKPAIGASFAFEQIKDACVALDSGSVNGKIVVTL